MPRPAQKRELGRHAFEERMPEQKLTLLNGEGDSNVFPDVVTQLTRLVELDDDVQVAYLCTATAVQISKLPDEGAHFCGYRNIQMLCLALGHAHPRFAFMQQKYSVPQLQAMIEKAWRMGINAHGLALTGGIQGTRKHIGTSEVGIRERMQLRKVANDHIAQAEALLLSLDIACTGNSFHGKDAWCDLLDFVEQYFAPTGADVNAGVHGTERLPIFLQRPKHSITIVGIEKLKSGKRLLLVFDPAWQPPKAMRSPSYDPASAGLSTWWMHRLYRKGERYLKRFTAFETLTVNETFS